MGRRREGGKYVADQGETGLEHSISGLISPGEMIFLDG
jgi:hypothetical protein